MGDSPIERGLAERLAQTIETLGDTVPVDLEALAGALGVTQILSKDMVEDGRTTWTDGRPLIELRADRPTTRTRFTLAHEIGHILVDRDESVARRTRSLEPDDIEKLCDWIAASILMPRRWIDPYTERDRYTLSLLRLVAHRADVSLSAAAVRLAEVGRNPCVLLRWQRAPTRWVVVGQAAVPRKYSGDLQATPDTNDILDALPNRQDTWKKITLVGDGTSLEATAHIDRSNKTCLSLLTHLEALS